MNTDNLLKQSTKFGASTFLAIIIVVFSFTLLFWVIKGTVEAHRDLVASTSTLTASITKLENSIHKDQVQIVEKTNRLAETIKQLNYDMKRSSDEIIDKIHATN